MTLHVGDVVRVKDSVHRHKGKRGSVASIVRVNPRRHLVTVGEKTMTRKVKGVEREFTIPVSEERSLKPVYEVGVDFAPPDTEGTLRTDLWFRPEELTPTGEQSRRVVAEKKPS